MEDIFKNAMFIIVSVETIWWYVEYKVEWVEIIRSLYELAGRPRSNIHVARLLESEDGNLEEHTCRTQSCVLDHKKTKLA